MSPLSALLLRDMRLAVRVGGGALMGVLFFLIVVTMVPFAIGPDAATAQRSARRSSGSAPCSPRCSRSTGCSRPTRRTARSISC
jgi:hypothetical protein